MLLEGIPDSCLAECTRNGDVRYNGVFHGLFADILGNEAFMALAFSGRAYYRANRGGTRCEEPRQGVRGYLAVSSMEEEVITFRHDCIR
jgi:hypothetical protein